MQLVRFLIALFIVHTLFALYSDVDAQSLPVVRIGRTFSGSGINELEARPITNGLNFWWNWFQTTRNATFTNNGVQYKLEFIQFDDASSVNNVKFMYEAMNSLYNLTAVFGPWTQNLTGEILPILRNRSIPLVISGAAGGGLFSGVNFNMVSLLVNGGKRSLPCFQLFKEKNAQTAMILYNSDTFMTFSGQLVYPPQLRSLNITVLENVSFAKGNEDFTDIVARIKVLKPDVLACAQTNNDLPFLLKQLRETLTDREQPKAIMCANTTPIQVSYNLVGWASDTLFGGDQWSPNFNYTDPIFGSSAEFTKQYAQYLTSIGINTSINFWDAASVAAGFVMLTALETTASFASADMIAALRAIKFDNTFFGPISFTTTGELNSTGICQQLLPSPDPAASVRTTTVRDLQVVYPTALASAEPVYPSQYVRPPRPSLTGRKRVVVIVVVTVLGFLLIVCIALGVFAFFRHKYHWIFISKKDMNGNDEWTKD